MANFLIRSGYDFAERVQLDFDGVPEDVSSATIEASLVSYDKTSELITDTAQTNSGTGVDWSLGIVGIVFPASATTSLTPQRAWIELAVVIGSSRLPYPSIPVTIEKGWTT